MPDDRDDLSLVVPPRNYFDIVKLREPNIVDQLKEHPLLTAMEILTGAAGGGMKGLFVSLGRIGQSVLKADLQNEVISEFRRLSDAGKIRDDFGKTKYGFQTWVELMRMIDGDDCPDPDRLEALKAMFFAMNKANSADAEQIQAYQLWQIAKQLNSGELLLLKTAYEHRHESEQQSYNHWADHMAKKSGLGSRAMVSLYEKRPTEMFLYSERVHGDLSGIRGANARLTDLGLLFCGNIATYKIELASLNE